MKPTKLMVLAAWMIEQLSCGLKSEALSGDLLEELHLGRSAAWYWRQVCSAVAAGVLSKFREYALPLIFCAAWSSLYRGWNLLSKAALAHTMPSDWGTPAWPSSALLPLGYGMVPALTFVWLGFLVYVLSRPRVFHELTAHRVLRGLSASLNVLLVSTVVLLQHFRQSRPGLLALKREDFYSAFHLLWISVPIGLSLLAALSSTVTRSPRLVRRQRLPRLQIAGRIQRTVSGPLG